jgi:hypothetical protein
MRSLAGAGIVGVVLVWTLALVASTAAVAARAPAWTDIPFPEGETAVDVAEDSDRNLWATTLEASGTFGHVMVLREGASAWEDACEGLDWNADSWSSGLLAVDDKLFLATLSGACFARSASDMGWHQLQSAVSLAALTEWDGAVWASAGFLGVARLDPDTELVETVADGLTVVMDNPDAAFRYRNPRGNDDYLYVGSTVSPGLASSDGFSGVTVYRLAEGTTTWEDTGLAVTPREGDLASAVSGAGAADWGAWNVVPTDGYVICQVLSQGAGTDIRCFLYEEESGTWSDVEMPDTEGGWWYLASGEPCFARDGEFYFPTGFMTDGVVCDVLDPGSQSWRQGVTVKGTTWEPLVNTAQMVGDELLVARVEGSQATGAEPSFVEAVPLPTEISSDPGVIGTNFGLALLFALVFGFTSTLFNSALRANYLRMAQAFAPLARGARAIQRGVWGLLRKLAAGLKALLSRSRGVQKTPAPMPHLGRRWLERLAVVLLAALIYAFLDPTFGFSGHGANIYFSLALSIAVVTFAYEGTQTLTSAWGYQIPAAVKLFPAAIVVAVFCVILSRLTGFVPGYLYGFVGGMAFLTAWRPDERREARMVLTGSLCLLVVSLGAWFLTLAVAPPPGGGGGGLERTGPPPGRAPPNALRGKTPDSVSTPLRGLTPASCGTISGMRNAS